MIYSRAIYDLASIIKLFVDKLDAADQVQVLVLLNNIKQYLDVGHVSVAVKFDEPLVTVNKLIVSIKNINEVNQLNVGSLPTSKELLVDSTSLLDASDIRVLRVPASSQETPVSRQIGGKRLYCDLESDISNHAYSSHEEDQDMYEEVVGDETELQPIVMLERALTAVANDQPNSKAVYVFEPSSSKQYINKSKKNVQNPREPKLYLPEGVEFSNPAAQTVRKQGDRKWPENSKWICVYCRLILKNLKSYKLHLTVSHQDERCCCRFCKREVVNLEMLKFHLCVQRHQCPVCKKHFTRPYKLNNHMSTHYYSARAKVTCKVCHEKYSSATECAMHVYEDHEMIIVCDCCGKDFIPRNPESRSASRIYCDTCADSTKSEPMADIANLNPDIEIEKMKFDAAIDSVHNATIKFSRVSQKGKDGGGRSLKTPQYCDACDETVMGETNWKKHLLKTSHIQAFANKSGTTCEPISCDVCGRNFISKEKLEHHSRVHQEGYHEQEYECKTCGKRLKTIGGYKTHMASHTSQRYYSCKICHRNFKNMAGLRDHNDVVHSNNRIFPCIYCGVEFNNRKIRSKHYSLYHHNFIYRCKYCSYNHRNGDSMKTHIKMYHPEIEWTKPKDYRHVADEPFEGELPSAPKRFKSGVAIASDGGDKYKCEVCNISYKTLKLLNKHKNTVTHIRNEALAQGVKPQVFPCTECGKDFYSQKSLDSHIFVNHDQGKSAHKCSKCNKCYLSAAGLNAHLVTHTEERQFACPSCDAEFYTSSALSTHLRAKHMSKEFPCIWCDLVFQNKKQRKRHVDLIHKNYIYRCTECTYETRYASAIHKHLTTEHSAIKWTTPKDYRHIASKSYLNSLSNDGDTREDFYSDYSENDGDDISVDSSVFDSSVLSNIITGAQEVDETIIEGEMLSGDATISQSFDSSAACNMSTSFAAAASTTTTSDMSCQSTSL